MHPRPPHLPIWALAAHRHPSGRGRYQHSEHCSVLLLELRWPIGPWPDTPYPTPTTTPSSLFVPILEMAHSFICSGVIYDSLSITLLAVHEQSSQALTFGKILDPAPPATSPPAGTAGLQQPPLPLVQIRSRLSHQTTQAPIIHPPQLQPLTVVTPSTLRLLSPRLVAVLFSL